VIRQVRPKLACACCDKIVQAEAPSRPNRARDGGPGLLAHVLVSKYCDHLPLYRQSEIYARDGVEPAVQPVGGNIEISRSLFEMLANRYLCPN
jgi:transposase